MQHGPLLVGQVEILEEIDHELDRLVLVRLALRVQQVQARRALQVRRVEEHQPASQLTSCRESGEEVVDEVPVGVDQQHARAVADVVLDQEPEQAGLTAAWHPTDERRHPRSGGARLKERTPLGRLRSKQEASLYRQRLRFRSRRHDETEMCALGGGIRHHRPRAVSPSGSDASACNALARSA